MEIKRSRFRRDYFRAHLMGADAGHFMRRLNAVTISGELFIE